MTIDNQDGSIYDENDKRNLQMTVNKISFKN